MFFLKFYLYCLLTYKNIGIIIFMEYENIRNPNIKSDNRIIIATVRLLTFMARMYDHERTIGIGDGSVPDDGAFCQIEIQQLMDG